MNASGISLWRQVGETLLQEIDQGVLSPGERLPTDADLAARFQVNRHTVRRALAHLQNEGLLRVER
ncbi:MAG TPA: GntR family transcriptional regulator, partial [Bradyrhizobium sp.]|nr:GntR family transcriptional regulator [Bradyrhizobium sp.]